MLLDISNLTVEFGRLRALNNFGLKIDYGEVVAFVGPNGAGKTTCFNAITGFLKPTNGSIKLEGEEIVKLKPYEIARKGLVRTFQQTSLFSDMTVFENVFTIECHRREPSYLRTVRQVLLGRKAANYFREAEKKTYQILDMFGLKSKRDVLARELPHVDQRSLSVAIGLVNKPKVLLLDEPASGMTLDEQLQLVNLLKKVNETGTALLVVEHHMRFVMGLAQRIIVINHGMKIVEGTPSEIQANEEVRRIYLGREGVQHA